MLFPLFFHNKIEYCNTERFNHQGCIFKGMRFMERCGRFYIKEVVKVKCRFFRQNKVDINKAVVNIKKYTGKIKYLKSVFYFPL